MRARPAPPAIMLWGSLDSAMINLVQETKSSLSWVKDVLVAFWRVRPGTTLALIISLTAKNFFSLLAGFLPLKVILLAGSDGVPRYFQFFIPSDTDKIPWIIGFTIAAVVFFILTLIMEAIAKKLSAAGSHEVLQGANELAVASKQREEAGGYFSQFSEIAANSLILTFALTLLAAVNLNVFFTLTSLLLIQYLFTTGVLGFTDPLKPGPIRKAIQNRLRNYLGLWSSVIFLACFFVLLIPFLTGVGGNLLLAILSLLLMNQATGAAGGIVKNTRKLWVKQAQISPLVFREERSLDTEKPVTRELRLMFEPEARRQAITKRLKAVGLPVSQVHSQWQDPILRGAYTFHLTVQTPEPDQAERIRHLQQQVFPARQLNLLEHEEFLFTKITRESVQAPTVLARYEDEPFTCQICDYGSGKTMTANDWKTRSPELLADLWCLDLPRDLISAYRTAQPGLEARLLPELLQRIEVALEDQPARRTYDRFLNRLPEIQKIIARMPLHLHNPDLNNKHVALDDENQPLIMTWVRWQLLPLGSALPPTMKEEQISALIERMEQQSRIKRGAITAAHVMLVHHCQKLEDAIKRECFNSALLLTHRALTTELLN